MNKLRGFAAVSLLVVVACDGGPVDPEVTVESVTVSPRTATIPQPGETAQLTTLAPKIAEGREWLKPSRITWRTAG